MNAAVSQSFVLRAHLLWWNDDPFFAGQSAQISVPDGAMAVGADGRIAWVGEAANQPNDYTAWPEVDRRGTVVLPGFIDAHLHFPQSAIIGAYGTDLLHWLDTYTFPEESRFGDQAHAASIAAIFADTLLRYGVTSACVFSTIHPVALEELAAAFHSRGMGLLSGKTAMDRNAIPTLHDTAQSAYDDAKVLLEALEPQYDRFGYVVTPRFAITSTEAQLDVCGSLHAEFPHTRMQTHINESAREIATVAQLFPNDASYLDVYDRFGLVTDRSLFAHGIHTTEAEMARMAEAGAAVVHCPTSNTFLGSGLFNPGANRAAGVNIGIGCDIGGGTHFSPFVTMQEAYKVARFHDQSLTAAETYYWHTLGNARAMKTNREAGSLAAGKWADFIVLSDPDDDPIAALRLAHAETVEQRLFAYQFFAPQIQTWTRGIQRT